jgi:hypothetical protein
MGRWICCSCSLVGSLQGDFLVMGPEKTPAFFPRRNRVFDCCSFFPHLSSSLQISVSVLGSFVYVGLLALLSGFVGDSVAHKVN